MDVPVDVCLLWCGGADWTLSLLPNPPQCGSPGLVSFTNLPSFEWVCLVVVALQFLALSVVTVHQFPGAQLIATSSSSDAHSLPQLLRYFAVVATLFPTDQGHVLGAWIAAFTFVVLLLLQLVIAALQVKQESLANLARDSTTPFLFDYVLVARSSPVAIGPSFATSHQHRGVGGPSSRGRRTSVAPLAHTSVGGPLDDRLSDLRSLATFGAGLRKWFFRGLRAQLSLCTVGVFFVPLILALLRPLQCDYATGRHLYTAGDWLTSTLGVGSREGNEK